MANKLLNILAATAILTSGLTSCAPSIYKHEVTSKTELVVRKVKKYDHHLTLTIQKGENLSGIAERMTALTENSDYPLHKKVTWQELYEQNPQIGRNPNLIHPGQLIRYDSSRKPKPR